MGEESEDLLIDIDIIPTQEEMEKTIKNITENLEITFEDLIVLSKMKFIKLVLYNRDKKI